LLLYTQNLTTEKPQRGDINIAWGNALGNPFYADGLIWGPHKINAKDAKDASLLLYTQNLTTEKPQRGDINIAWATP